MVLNQNLLNFYLFLKNSYFLIQVFQLILKILNFLNILEIKTIALERTKDVFNEFKKFPFFFKLANERISLQIVSLLSSSIVVYIFLK